MKSRPPDCERPSCECRYWAKFRLDATMYHRFVWYYAEPYPNDGGWIDNSDGPPMVRFEFRISIGVGA